MNFKSIAVVGMMGAGKSTVAQQLATRLEWPWYDLDHETETIAGESIPRLFAQSGETGFRRWEREALSVVAKTYPRPHVLATGGGTPLSSANREILDQAYQVVWLDADPELLWARVADSDRPLVRHGKTDFLKLAAARRPVYRQVAHMRIDVGSLSPAQIVDVILKTRPEEEGGEL